MVTGRIQPQTAPRLNYLSQSGYCPFLSAPRLGEKQASSCSSIGKCSECDYNNDGKPESVNFVQLSGFHCNFPKYVTSALYYHPHYMFYFRNNFHQGCTVSVFIVGSNRVDVVFISGVDYASVSLLCTSLPNLNCCCGKHNDLDFWSFLQGLLYYCSVENVSYTNTETDPDEVMNYCLIENDAQSVSYSVYGSSATRYITINRTTARESFCFGQGYTQCTLIERICQVPDHEWIKISCHRYDDDFESILDNYCQGGICSSSDSNQDSKVDFIKFSNLPSCEFSKIFSSSVTCDVFLSADHDQGKIDINFISGSKNASVRLRCKPMPNLSCVNMYDYQSINSFLRSLTQNCSIEGGSYSSGYPEGKVCSYDALNPGISYRYSTAGGGRRISVAVGKVEEVSCSNQGSSCVFTKYSCSGMDDRFVKNLGCDVFENYLNSITKDCNITHISSGDKCSYDALKSEISYKYSSQEREYKVDISEGKVYVDSCSYYNKMDCTIAEYSCSNIDRGFIKDLACSGNQDYLKNLISSCKTNYEGSGVKWDNYNSCYLIDWNKDGKPDGFYIKQKDGFSIDIWVGKNIYGEGNYLMITMCFGEGQCYNYMSSAEVGKGKCKFPASSCKDFGYSIDQAIEYIESIISTCDMKNVGSYTGNGKAGEPYQSCVQNNFETDGVPSKIISGACGGQRYSVAVKRDGRARKSECQAGNCKFYEGKECSFDCNPSGCKWQDSGYLEGGKTCWRGDFDNDKKEEIIISILPSDFRTSRRITIAIIKPDGSSAVAYCSVDESLIDRPVTYVSQATSGIRCNVELGICKIDSCPQKGEDLEKFIKSNCSLSGYGSCEGFDKCQGLLFGAPEYKSDEIAGYCLKIVNAKTGEFVSIKKVKDGYEYIRGDRKSSSYNLCSQKAKADFRSCSIYGCDDQKKTDIEVFDFAEDSTKQSFDLKIRGTDKGLEGTMKVSNYKGTGKSEMSGRFVSADGTFLIKGDSQEDGSMSFSVDLVTLDGRFIRGRYLVLPDGSGSGEVQDADGTIYRVRLNSDGTSNISR
ncbi:MAG: hypothetical protein NZ927_03890 [Candidatus Calescibacterium sp.]|nr:hypothetical protein [Candidatus Calescibacterium sp.]